MTLSLVRFSVSLLQYDTVITILFLHSHYYTEKRGRTSVHTATYIHANLFKMEVAKASTARTGIVRSTDQRNALAGMEPQGQPPR